MLSYLRNLDATALRHLRSLVYWLTHPGDDEVKTMPETSENEATGESVGDDPRAMYAELTAHHMSQRCDRCRAAARTRWLLRNLVLTLCGHHTRDHQAALLEQQFRRG